MVNTSSAAFGICRYVGGCGSVELNAAAGSMIQATAATGPHVQTPRLSFGAVGIRHGIPLSKAGLLPGGQLFDHERKIFAARPVAMINLRAKMGVIGQGLHPEGADVSVEPIVEFSFGIAAQGYERSAVDARIEELALEHENLLRRAEDLQHEITETARAVSARGEQAQFAFVLGRLQSTLGAAYAESTGLQRAGETRDREKRRVAHEMTRRQLAQLEDESQRAVAAAEASARRLIAEAGSAAAEIRQEAAEAAARIAAGAQDVMEAARTKTEQRTREIVGELTAWQQAHESAQAATQAAADGRLEQAGRAAAAYGEQARSTLDCAAQTASRMTGEARLEAERLLAEIARGRPPAPGVRTRGRGGGGQPAQHRAVRRRPAVAGGPDGPRVGGRPTGGRLGPWSISEISALWPRRRTRGAAGQEPGRAERIRREPRHDRRRHELGGLGARRGAAVGVLLDRVADVPQIPSNGVSGAGRTRPRPAAAANRRGSQRY